MSIFNGSRLPLHTFKLDVERMRKGWYSDKYFYNTVEVLRTLANRGYRYSNQHVQKDGSLAGISIGDIEVEMQWFTRRKPYSVVAGVDKALAILQTCTGFYREDGLWEDTYSNFEVEAVHDGVIVNYDSDPMHVQPVLRVRGCYRDFAMLETPTLGALTRGTRIATNVYKVMEAAQGKDVLYFPARFDAHELQAADGYAYHIAVQAYNQRRGRKAGTHVSTDEQGDWWGGAGGGTVAHAAIACFLGDTAETMMCFADVLPPAVPRIALVDFHNDCIADTLQTMRRMFDRYRQLLEDGQEAEAMRYKLYGVRPDTGGLMRDVSLEPLGDPRLDNGVNPRLCFRLRAAMDDAWKNWGLPLAWQEHAENWCRGVKLVVTGGFTPERIRSFEQMGVPVDVYGVGSALLSNCSEHGTANDFTADIVRVKIDGEWVSMSKVGRTACDNPDLQPAERLME